MEHIIFWVILLIIIYCLLKISRVFWRVINSLLLLFLFWYFSETIFLYLHQVANWVPNQTISDGMTAWINWLADKMESLKKAFM